jgi:hypothetical protein
MIKTAALRATCTFLMLTLLALGGMIAKNHQGQAQVPPSALDQLVQGHDCWFNDGHVHPTPTRAIAILDVRKGPEWVSVEKGFKLMQGHTDQVLQRFCA